MSTHHTPVGHRSVALAGSAPDRRSRQYRVTADERTFGISAPDPLRGSAVAPFIGRWCRTRWRDPSADRHQLPLPVRRDSLHDPLRSPEVDPRCLGGSVDRCAAAACCQHLDHSLDVLCSHTGCNQVRRKIGIGQCNRFANLCCIRLRCVLLWESQPSRNSPYGAPRRCAAYRAAYR
jgi:hypothetical protein